MANSIQAHFADLPDPRRAQGKRHRLSDMIVIAVCAVICCADSWADVADFGRAKLKWFKTFLDLPHGIPCQDTFERVFARLDPDAFERCFMSWTEALSGSSRGKLVAIDGKKIRRSFQHAWDCSTATHLVSAFVQQNATVLGQLAVDCKGNEIVAIPQLLELLDLGGALVTIDALGCQKAIAQQVVAGGGDYVLVVKGNQEHLLVDIQETVAQALDGELRAGAVRTYTTRADHHGRQEERSCVVIEHVAGIRDRRLWPGLTTVGMCRRERTVNGQSSTEVCYFIGSRRMGARRYAQALRSHWGIENNLH